MNRKLLVILIAFTLTAHLLKAQPNDAYINKLSGEINSDWLVSEGKNAQKTTLKWEDKAIHGFKSASTKVRKIAKLATPWTLYSVDSKYKCTKDKTVKLPHNFPQNRAYKSAWYITSFDFDMKSNKSAKLLLNRVQIFSLVYVNGIRLGHHFGALTPFDFDITSALKQGQNTVAIFVYDQTASIDGKGVYNQVGVTFLSKYKPDSPTAQLSGGIGDVPIIEVTEEQHIEDVFIKTSTRKGTMELDFEVSKNAVATKSNLKFELLKWPNGEKVAVEIPTIKLKDITSTTNSITVNWKDADLWSPDHPNLYVLRATLTSKKGIDVLETRFGFREFWIEEKSFILNGKPIRLRGDSHYRSKGFDVDFHRSIFEMQKEVFGINSCRLHASMPPNEVIQAADEAGVLIVNQSAIWSVNGTWYTNGGEWFNKNVEQEFKEWTLRDRNNPSVVIWDVENEMLRFSRNMVYPWVKKLPGYIKKYDNTRPFNYSGAGWFADEQEMISLHMQEHYKKIISDWQTKDNRPLIMGEFWIGGRSEQRLPNSPEFESTKQRYIEEALMYQERILEMRYLGVSAFMPFRLELLTFPKNHNNKNDRYSFTPPNTLKYDLRSKEVAAILHHTMQEYCTFFWPRKTYAASNKSFERELVICNDGETKETFDISWNLKGEKTTSQQIILKPAEQKRIKINVATPEAKTQLIAKLSINNKVVSVDSLDIIPFDVQSVKNSKPLQIFENEALATTLNSLGLKASSKANIPKASDDVIWVIAENANNRILSAMREDILAYINEGGKILCLKQDQAPTWFPVKLKFWSGNQASLHTFAKMGWEGVNKYLFYATIAPIYAPTHPIFKGINNESLHLWNEFDGRISDDVFARPSSTNNYEQGNWTPLAGGTRREHVSLAEINCGAGTLIACQLELIQNLKNEQAATIFANIINYLSFNQSTQYKQKVAIAGNMSAQELSTLTAASAISFVPATDAKQQSVFAFEGADIEQLKKMAAEGCTVIVLSSKVSAQLEGVEVAYEKEDFLLATKIGHHQLISGVGSANFLDQEKTGINGYFTNIPLKSKPLLQGFAGTDLWKCDDRGPVMIALPYGKGEMLLSTININPSASNMSREFLGQLLTNSAVEIKPSTHQKQETIVVKKTVPVNIDGKLEEWLEEMEDRLVSPYIHAQPVYLTSESIVEGPANFDMSLSAINYLMWNKEGLHIAGVVFMDKKLFGGETMNRKNFTQHINLNDEQISVTLKNNKMTAMINNIPIDVTNIKKGTIDSKTMTDATKLQFNYLHASGKIVTAENIEGEVFEILIPWSSLKLKPTDEAIKALFSIQSFESKIQVPINAKTNAKDNWADIIFSTKEK